MTSDQQPRPQGQIVRRWERPARPRDVTPTFDHGDAFNRAREAAEQHRCRDAPRGCGMPAGRTCTVIGRPDILLTRQPAHLCRLQDAGLAAPSVVGTGARRETDRPPTAPIPAANRHVYEEPPS